MGGKVYGRKLILLSSCPMSYLMFPKVTMIKTRRLFFWLHYRFLMLLNWGVGEDSWESLGLQEDQNSLFYSKSVLNIRWKDWCWSWSSNTLATWCEELTHQKRPWCWERLKAGREGDGKGWDGRMASLTQWTWVWADSRSWWWTGKPGVLKSMGSQRIRHNWATELNYCLSLTHSRI